MLSSIQYAVKPPKSPKGARGSKKVKTFDSDQGGKKRKMRKVWSIGQKKTARVEIMSHARVEADSKRIEVSADAEANAYLFNKETTIVGFKTRFEANGHPNQERLAAQATMTVLGQDYVEHWSREGILEFEQSLWDVADEYGYAVRLWIGPIPVTVEIGAAFETGMSLRFILRATSIESETNPFLRADAYARFAVDLDVASSGIKGDFKLLDAEMNIGGKAEYGKDKGGVYLRYGYGVHAAVHALPGLSGFSEG